MFELLQHALGLCSDSASHPSILMFLSGGVGLGTLWHYIKFKIKGSKHEHEHTHDCSCHTKEKNKDI